jgi:hypothetical protein
MISAPERVFLETLAKSAHTPPASQCTGGVVEWSIAPVLKTGEPQGSVGSNPTPSANFFRYMFQMIEIDQTTVGSSSVSISRSPN